MSLKDKCGFLNGSIEYYGKEGEEGVFREKDVVEAVEKLKELMLDIGEMNNGTINDKVVNYNIDQVFGFKEEEKQE